jgi:hypothetical protein
MRRGCKNHYLNHFENVLLFLLHGNFELDYSDGRISSMIDNQHQHRASKLHLQVFDKFIEVGFEIV